jgi:hypothetical protein
MPGVDQLTSSPAYITVGNPSPGISTSVAPVVERLQPAELTFSGSSIMPGIRASIGGSARPTTFVSTSLVRVKLDTLDAGTAGSVSIRFENPSPTFGYSSPTVSVVNPIPIATELTPRNATVGGPAFTLTIKGAHFVPESIVKVNGSPRITTYVSTTTLRASIPASDLTQGGDLPITIASPPPRGGTSATLNLTRLYPQIIVK